MEETDNDAPEYPGSTPPPGYPQRQPSTTLGQMQQPAAEPEKKTNTMAILSLIISFFIGLLGIIFGIIALNQIKNNPGQKGKGLAIAGIIIGAIGGIVIILLMIGSMAYFRVLNPSTMLPNKCVISPGFSCADYSASADNTVINIRLNNNLGQDIQKATLLLGGECSPKDAPWSNGQALDFVCRPAAMLISVETFRTDFTLNYLTVDGAYPQTASGNINIRYN